MPRKKHFRYEFPPIHLGIDCKTVEMHTFFYYSHVIIRIHLILIYKTNMYVSKTKKQLTLFCVVENLKEF